MELLVLDPGFGLLTATPKVPAEFAVPPAVSCVAETKVVARGVPEKRIFAPFTNPEPVIEIENEPVANEVGLTLESTGTGF